MNRKQTIRLSSIVSLLVLLSMALGLVLYALKQNINLFYTPTELFAANVPHDQTVRLGGYVKDHSVHYDLTGESVDFIVTDRAEEITVYYHGILPNLFREGQTVVVTGEFTGKNFSATQVLAKHDEKYMPKALAQSLERKAHAT